MSKDVNILFSNNSVFDTRKTYNLSKSVVPNEILNKIESGITIEDIENLQYPILKYKTQITIHGIFDELKQNNIGRYYNIFQNSNKSIGIKYTAIDTFKKQKLIHPLYKCGFDVKSNSTEYVIIKRYIASSREELYKKFDLDETTKMLNNLSKYYLGSSYITEFYNMFFKEYSIDINIKLYAIYENDIEPFFFILTDKSFNEINEELLYEEQKRNEILRQETIKKERLKEILKAKKEKYLSEEFKYKLIDITNYTKKTVYIISFSLNNDEQLNVHYRKVFIKKDKTKTSKVIDIYEKTNTIEEAINSQSPIKMTIDYPYKSLFFEV